MDVPVINSADSCLFTSDLCTYRMRSYISSSVLPAYVHPAGSDAGTYMYEGYNDRFAFLYPPSH